MFQKGILHRLIGLLLKKLMTSGQLYCPWSPVPLIKEIYWSKSLYHRSDVFSSAVHEHCWNGVCNLHCFPDFAFQRFGVRVPTVWGPCWWRKIWLRRGPPGAPGVSPLNVLPYCWYRSSVECRLCVGKLLCGLRSPSLLYKHCHKLCMYPCSWLPYSNDWLLPLQWCISGRGNLRGLERLREHWQ